MTCFPSVCFMYIDWWNEKNANIHMLPHQENVDHFFSQITLCLDDFAKIWELSLHSVLTQNEPTQQQRSKIKLLLPIFYPFDVYFQCPFLPHLQSESHSITTESLPSNKNTICSCLRSKPWWSQESLSIDLERFDQALSLLWKRMEILLQCFEGFILLLQYFTVQFGT